MLGPINKLKEVPTLVLAYKALACGLGLSNWLKVSRAARGRKPWDFLLNYLLSPGGEKTIDLTGNLINFLNLTDKVRGACGSRPPTRQCIRHAIKLPEPPLGRELLLEGLRSAVASDPGGMHPTPVMPYGTPFRKVLHAQPSGVQSSKSWFAITCEVKTANRGMDGLDDCKSFTLWHRAPWWKQARNGP